MENKNSFGDPSFYYSMKFSQAGREGQYKSEILLSKAIKKNISNFT